MSECRFLTPCGICEIKSMSGIPYECDLRRICELEEEHKIPKEKTKSEDLNTTNCCDNCKFYKEAVSEYGNIFHKCKRPDIQQGPKAWINTKPTDFCSRYERRTSKR